MSDRIREALSRLRGQLPLFAEKNLKILPKGGGKAQPLIFNEAQVLAHAAFERALEDRGYLRAIVLKGRQQGISTLTAARFYHKASMNKGLKAYIIAHEQPASDNLFRIVKRYHESNPLRPVTGYSNAKELDFPKLQSGYKVATAGGKDVGRSGTSQLVHASEFGFWKNAELHIAGLGQTVAEGEGEIIIESTACGVGNVFHEYWQLAESGENGYVPIFIPWYLQAEYRAKVIPPDFQVTPKEEELMRVYGLDVAQIAWRRVKIASFGKGREWLFQQEYPCCPAEAFVSATEDPFISPALGFAAVNSGYLDRAGPLIIGVDPAEKGPDRTVLVFRRGRVVTRIEKYQGKDTMEVTGLVANAIKKYSPDAVFVDSIGIGAGVKDRLRELGHVNVIGVKSGERALNEDQFVNRRIEMWFLMREWLENGPVRLPNSPELLSDLSGPKYGYDSAGRWKLEGKPDMKTRGVRSPDFADALALTFAAPVVAVSDRHGSMPFRGVVQSALRPGPAGY